jgi:hypothetical protein
MAGLNAAGTVLGFSTLWGLESNAPDPRAGAGNGGAPTVSYTDPLPKCAIGVALQGSVIGSAGYHFQTCSCPPPTALFSGGQVEFPGSALADGWFTCKAPCPEGQAVQHGTCAACPSHGPNTSNEPDPSQTKCVLTAWQPACPAGSEYVTATGTCLPACASDQKRKSATHQCVAACVPPHVWDPQAHGCVTVKTSCIPPAHFSQGICVNPCTLGGTSTP